MLLANTVQQKEWDGRFSPGQQGVGQDRGHPAQPGWLRHATRNLDFVVDSHSGLVDLFLSQARQDYLRLQPLTPEEIHAEAARLFAGASCAGYAQQPPTAPTTWPAFRPDFLARAGTQAHDQADGAAAVSQFGESPA